MFGISVSEFSGQLLIEMLFKQTQCCGNASSFWTFSGFQIQLVNGVFNLSYFQMSCLGALTFNEFSLELWLQISLRLVGAFHHPTKLDSNLFC